MPPTTVSGQPHPDTKYPSASIGNSTMIHCRHVYKAAPGWPGECLKYKVDPIEKKPIHVPRACVPPEEFRYGRNSDDRRCCWYCPNLNGCGHPKWRCDDAVRLMAANLEPGFRVEGELV